MYMNIFNGTFFRRILITNKEIYAKIYLIITKMNSVLMIESFSALMVFAFEYRHWMTRGNVWTLLGHFLLYWGNVPLHFEECGILLVCSWYRLKLMTSITTNNFFGNISDRLRSNQIKVPPWCWVLMEQASFPSNYLQIKNPSFDLLSCIQWISKYNFHFTLFLNGHFFKRILIHLRSLKLLC